MEKVTSAKHHELTDVRTERQQMRADLIAVREELRGAKASADTAGNEEPQAKTKRRGDRGGHTSNRQV
jgi:hypothetical protein